MRIYRFPGECYRLWSGGEFGAVAARTPMPWSDGPGLGFTTGTPWLPPGGRATADTVAAQNGDPASPLSTMRRLLAARAAVPGDRPAALDEARADGGVVDVRRGRVQVVANFGPAASGPIAPAGPVVFDSDDPEITPEAVRVGPVRLAPGQAVVAFIGDRP